VLGRLAVLDLDDRAARRLSDHARDRLPAVEVAEVPAAAVHVHERGVAGLRRDEHARPQRPVATGYRQVAHRVHRRARRARHREPELLALGLDARVRMRHGRYNDRRT
jgi:hypothetical protein